MDAHRRLYRTDQNHPLIYKTISSDIPSDKNAGDRRANNIDPEKESEIIKFINRILSYLK